MATLQKVKFVVLVLLLCYSLKDCEQGRPSSQYVKDLFDVKASSILSRTKRETSNITTPNGTSVTRVPDPLLFDIVIDLSFSASSISPEVLESIKNQLSTIPSQPISSSLHLIDINITTTCSLRSDLSLYCQCEEQYLWPCDQCSIYASCSNATNKGCDCINGLPSNGTFCEPISTVQNCPTTTPNRTTMEPSTNRTTTEPSTTTTEPPTNRTTIEPSTNRTTTEPSTTIEPFTNRTTIEPSTNRTTMEPSTNRTTMEPSTNGTIIQPSTNRTTMEPSTNRTTEPFTNRTTIEPSIIITTIEPSTNRRTLEPSTNRTTTEPSINRTTIEPSTNRTTEPFTNRTTIEPSTNKTTIEPSTTTAPTATTTPTTTTSITTLVNETIEFTLNIPFNPSYNEETNTVRKNFIESMETQCRRQISNLDHVMFGSFRSGSTIANFTVFAPSIDPDQLDNVRVGLFLDLSKIYPVTLDSSQRIRFEPEEAFVGGFVTLFCELPPGISLATESTVTWLLDDVVIRKQTIKEGVSTLRQRFFESNNGFYKCQLETPNRSRIHQEAVKDFVVSRRPVLTVNRVQHLVSCPNAKVELACSVDDPKRNVFFPDFPQAGEGNPLSVEYDSGECNKEPVTFPCQVKLGDDFEKMEIFITVIPVEDPEMICISDTFGNGTLGFVAVAQCEPDFEGETTATCKESGEFEDVQDNCILAVIKTLLDESEFLTNLTLPDFIQRLSDATVNSTSEIVNSIQTIRAIVQIFENTARVAQSTIIEEDVMENALISAGILTTNGTREAWRTLNNPEASTATVSDSIRHLKSASQSLLYSQSRISETNVTSVSGSFLQSLEIITSRLVNSSVEISTPSILLNKTTFRDTFNGEFDSSVEIDIPEADGGTQTLTVVTLRSMNNVLPPRDEANSSTNIINGRVIIVQSLGDINNITFTFDVLNTFLNRPQCVFWNFSLFDGLGGWDGDGCELVLNINDTVTCNCNHLTSFSMLMSFGNLESAVLDYITFIGVSISLASLIICLIIEGIVWKKLRSEPVSHLRHISIVNIAVSLLIADIWFLVGAAISKRGDTPACTTAAFFIHLFYLALFFWMLFYAMMLLYYVVNIFQQNLSNTSLIGIAFAVGYGVPIIIAVITIAVTAPDGEYIQRSGLCWLNIKDSLALLAFVVPALSIVLINLIILIVVISKIFGRKSIQASAGEFNTENLTGIIKTLAVLTPFFGITWGLGVGIIVDPFNLGVHITFAIFNSLQGLSILIFGTLLDRNVRSELSRINTLTSSRSFGTSSTSNGNTLKGPNFFQRSRQRRGYNLSSSTNSEPPSFNT